MAETSFDARDVALAALTNLVRLMGAELVAGRHRDDLDLFERAVRNKIGSFTVNESSADISEAGLALAKGHVERALAQIRTQALAAQAQDRAGAAPQQQVRTPILQ